MSRLERKGARKNKNNRCFQVIAASAQLFMCFTSWPLSVKLTTIQSVAAWKAIALNTENDTVLQSETTFVRESRMR